MPLPSGVGCFLFEVVMKKSRSLHKISASGFSVWTTRCSGPYLREYTCMYYLQICRISYVLTCTCLPGSLWASLLLLTRILINNQTLPFNSNGPNGRLKGIAAKGSLFLLLTSSDKFTTTVSNKRTRWRSSLHLPKTSPQWQSSCLELAGQDGSVGRMNQESLK